MHGGVVSTLALSGTRRNPAHCSKAFGPSFLTFSVPPGVERAVFLPVSHDIFGYRGA